MRSPSRSRVVAIGLAAAMPLGILALQQSIRLAFLRFRKPIGPPTSRLDGAQPVSFAAEDGISLSGWWLQGRSAAHGTVLLVHGIGGNRLTLVRRARTLHRDGFSVLLFDLRAHGESGGSHIGFGFPEARDVAAAIELARARNPGGKLGAIAISLGGAAVLLASEPPRLDALVLESVFPDIRPAIDTRIAATLRSWVSSGVACRVAPALGRLFAWLLPILTGVRPGTLRPAQQIGMIHAPVLIASGSLDPFTTMADTRALFERANAPKTLWWADGAEHTDLERFAPEPYWNAVLPFLHRHLRE
ncbi:lysophospholipase [Acetobacteraceae bacterium KSS8]|uniref:Lysophospholipase n=1 Tax=Endosaccharibacter trunci TaxID=2812733 RepID=A0ABT1WA53_9PROT|nr:lysophospholipase [Acetobacteraceae bacterium KSS8]